MLGRIVVRSSPPILILVALDSHTPKSLNQVRSLFIHEEIIGSCYGKMKITGKTTDQTEVDHA